MEKENFMKYIKYVIIIGVIILGYIFIAFLANGNNVLDNKTDYIVIGNSLIYKRNGKNLVQLDEVPSDISDQKFTVYSGTNKIENVKLQYSNNEWYFFDEDYNQIEANDFKVAFTGNDVKAANYTVGYYDGMHGDVLEDLLSKNELSLNSTFEKFTSYYEFDFDDDGEDERIYTTTNVSLSEAADKYYSAIYMVKNDNLSQVISSNSNKPYSVYSILDIDNDGKWELVVAVDSVDVTTFDMCYQIYKLIDGKWQLVQGCR